MLKIKRPTITPFLILINLLILTSNLFSAGTHKRNNTHHANNGNTTITNNTNVTWCNHKYKHFPPRNKSWKSIIISTIGKAAKYHPSIEKNIEKLEREVWMNGFSCSKDFPWKIKSFDKIIGASNGEETTYIKVEYGSNNSIHGHPINEEEVDRLMKKCPVQN